MPYDECISAVLKMNLSTAGLSRLEAEVHLDVLAAAAPAWISLHRKGPKPAQVRIARLCTGVRQELEDIAYGYAPVGVAGTLL
jgi:hypothetical protein